MASLPKTDSPTRQRVPFAPTALHPLRLNNAALMCYAITPSMALRPLIALASLSMMIIDVPIFFKSIARNFFYQQCVLRRYGFHAVSIHVFYF